MELHLKNSAICLEAFCHLTVLVMCPCYAVSTTHACQCWLQGQQADRYITPPKRTKLQPYIARKGKWVTVEQMEISNGNGKHEVYRPGESVFVLGNAEQPYVCGEPLCLLCDQASEVEDRGSDLLECDRCMAAVHIRCAALTEVPKVSTVQKT